MNPYAPRTHEEMKEVLLDKNATGPAIHYHMIRGGKEKRNVTTWECGTIGTEFIKAYGHYHVDGIPETYWIKQGQGILLLQKRIMLDGKPQNDKLESCTAIYVKAGDEINIPGDEGHTMVNIGNTWLVTVDDSPIAGTTPEEISKPAHADYSAIKSLQGFGYYATKSADGTAQFVPNEHYMELPPIQVFESLELYKGSK